MGFPELHAELVYFVDVPSEIEEHVKKVKEIVDTDLHVTVGPTVVEDEPVIEVRIDFKKMYVNFEDIVSTISQLLLQQPDSYEFHIRW